jgi:hypothetical protein
MNRHVILRIPVEHWDVLHESLELDARSSASDHGLRESINTALESIEDVTKRAEQVCAMFRPDEERHFDELLASEGESEATKNHVVHALCAIDPT